MTLRLAHLSDVHFGGEDKGAAWAAVEAVQAYAPDLVVVTGDLTLNGKPAEFKAARDWLARLPQPRLVTPGNHDTPYWNPVLRVATPFQRYQRYIGRPDSDRHDGPGLLALAVNSARGPQMRLDWSKGSLNPEQAAEAGAAFTQRSQAFKVFACHHPLVEPPGLPVSGAVAHGPERAATLARAGADLILTGHVHKPFAVSVAVDDRIAYGVGGGTLSVRTRHFPASYAVLEIDETTIQVSVQAWRGAAFELASAWTLPRRQLPRGPAMPLPEADRRMGAHDDGRAFWLPSPPGG